jgi:hypothetical protein
MIGKYLLNILISIDQLGNTVLGGDPDETISSRLGKIKIGHGGRIPWYRPLCKVIDWGLELIDPGHSVDAIEGDEGKDALIDR